MKGVAEAHLPDGRVCFPLGLYSVSPYGNLTGAPISSVNHVRALLGFFTFACLVLSQDGAIRERADQAGIFTHVWPIANRGFRAAFFRRTWFRDMRAVLGSRWGFLCSFVRELKRHPGLVHVHSTVSIAPLALGAARWCGLPSVLHIRESSRTWKDRLGVRVLAGMADAVVCVSDAVRRGYGPAVRRRARVVYNYVELPSEGVRCGNANPVVTMVASMLRAKGVDLFLQACQRLNEGGTPFEAWMVGAWPRTADRESARQFIEANGLQGRVILCDQQSDVASIYARTDVLLLPTRRDSLPRAVMEAMAHGLPVVATRVDGIPEMVEEGVTGYLVEPEDVEGFAAAVTRLLRNEGLRRQMGQAGRARAARLFSAEAYERAMLGLYRELLDGR